MPAGARQRQQPPCSPCGRTQARLLPQKSGVEKNQKHPQPTVSRRFFPQAFRAVRRPAPRGCPPGARLTAPPPRGAETAPGQAGRARGPAEEGRGRRGSLSRPPPGPFPRCPPGSLLPRRLPPRVAPGSRSPLTDPPRAALPRRARRRLRLRDSEGGKEGRRDRGGREGWKEGGSRSLGPAQPGRTSPLPRPETPSGPRGPLREVPARCCRLLRSPGARQGLETLRRGVGSGLEVLHPALGSGLQPPRWGLGSGHGPAGRPPAAEAGARPAGWGARGALRRRLRGTRGAPQFPSPLCFASVHKMSLDITGLPQAFRVLGSPHGRQLVLL